MTLFLTASQLEAATDMSSTISAVESIFKDIAEGMAHQPSPVAMQLPSSDANFIVMSGLAAGPGLAAVKLLSDIPSNFDKGLPTQRSTILLTDQRTGEPLAVLDGKVPTRVRTAAASAVASKHLARRGSTTLGLVGAGTLAVAHLEAMLLVLPIDTVIVWSRSASTVRTFQEATAHHGIKTLQVSSPREVVEASDVVCTLTPSESPILHGEWFMPGLHLNAVGARPRASHREIDAKGMAGARVFVDSMDTARIKSGDLLLAVRDGTMELSDVAGELGGVIAGTTPGRADDSDITLFNSVGVGSLDLAIGRLLFDAAQERGLGLTVDMSS
ncbi:ornithine cyclodeaminase family protein [Arthrobacter sp. ISL-72]|uniref:ornithine cyclodeaminase family protein n=1 Tax=Arthrobacter sp. ISL-72 TaxID=2819114 RepID=UPI001BE73CCB|nr:ornithine cyclodeaminase family protein [Arthrobacter sp. ISL-72]MBT2597666.1 ornithine cyclodeaminase family protein [Arthrobacter sp. ISL-72]